MEFEQRRLKRQFIRRKKRAIREATVECKNNVDVIMDSEHISFVKIALSVAEVASWQRYVDMVRAQSYYPDRYHQMIDVMTDEMKEDYIIGNGLGVDGEGGQS